MGTETRERIFCLVMLGLFLAFLTLLTFSLPGCMADSERTYDQAREMQRQAKQDALDLVDYAAMAQREVGLTFIDHAFERLREQVAAPVIWRPVVGCSVGFILGGLLVWFFQRRRVRGTESADQNSPGTQPESAADESGSTGSADTRGEGPGR